MTHPKRSRCGIFHCWHSGHFSPGSTFSDWGCSPIPILQMRDSETSRGPGPRAWLCACAFPEPFRPCLTPTHPVLPSLSLRPEVPKALASSHFFASCPLFLATPHLPASGSPHLPRDSPACVATSLKTSDPGQPPPFTPYPFPTGGCHQAPPLSIVVSLLSPPSPSPVSRIAWCFGFHPWDAPVVDKPLLLSVPLFLPFLLLACLLVTPSALPDVGGWLPL